MGSRKRNPLAALLVGIVRFIGITFVFLSAFLHVRTQQHTNQLFSDIAPAGNDLAHADAVANCAGGDCGGSGDCNSSGADCGSGGSSGCGSDTGCGGADCGGTGSGSCGSAGSGGGADCGGGDK